MSNRRRARDAAPFFLERLSNSSGTEELRVFG
jgi:hypothetical protein